MTLSRFSILLINILLTALLSAENIYVDQTLGSNITNGSYSISNRDNSGSDGDAYITIQAAITASTVGDSILMRGGTYAISTHGTSYADGYYIRIDYNTKQGTSWAEGYYYTLCSYPDEWAIIDGEDLIGNEYPARCGIGHAESSSSNVYDIAYWKFERFEIKNCETQDDQRAAAFGINGGPIWYRYLYIHDNTAAVEGNNPSGIRMQHMHDCIIEYCCFYNNGTEITSPAKNSTDIVTITDYGYQSTIASGGDVSPSSYVASRRNIIRYNYFMGGSTGFKYKGAQLLSGRGEYLSDAHCDEGDNIHHNIFQNYGYGGIMCRVDFAQVHHNILDDGTWGIMLGYEDPSAIIHKIVCYNNTITGSVNRDGISFDNGIRRKYATNYDQDSTPYPVFGWDFNNIIDDCEVGRDGDKSIAIGCQSGGAVLDLSDYYNSNNYFYRPPDTDIISLVTTTSGSSSNNYTLAEFEAQTETHTPREAYSNAFNATDSLYAGTTGANKYITRGSHVVEGSTTIQNGGIGGSHPYLNEVTIPPYLGAVNPNSYAWVSSVLDSLSSVAYLTAASGDPDWLETGDDSTPPNCYISMTLNGTDSTDIAVTNISSDVDTARFYYPDSNTLIKTQYDNTNLDTTLALASGYNYKYLYWSAADDSSNTTGMTLLDSIRYVAPVESKYVSEIIDIE